MYFKEFSQLLRMTNDTNEVVNHRLALMRDMAINPAEFANPTNWLELNRMVTEKVFAFGLANTQLWLSLSQLPPGKLPSASKTMSTYQKTLRPVRSTVGKNARRLKKKR